jgi:hypothetical protein
MLISYQFIDLFCTARLSTKAVVYYFALPGGQFAKAKKNRPMGGFSFLLISSFTQMREQDNLTNGWFIGQQHNQTVNTHTETTGWGHTIR